MDRWVGRVALVTGASAGIGAGLCSSLVEHGMIVIGAARRLEETQKLADTLQGKKGKLVPYQCDVTKDEEVYELFTYIKDNFKTFDVCINNAGRAVTRPLLDAEPNEMRGLMDLNVIAMCLCTKLSVSLMKEKGVDDGQIINMSSQLAHKVLNTPPAHFYCATKFAVKALTEGFRQELKTIKSGIRISAISPGFVLTEINAKIAENQEYAHTLADLVPMSISDVADAIVYILSAPPTVEVHDMLIIPTFDIKI